MKTQHTPGPWALTGNAGNIYSLTDTRHVATVVGPVAMDKAAHSNARLIASAPALLDALKALMECEPIASLISGTTALADATLAARAAIAQAEGGAL